MKVCTICGKEIGPLSYGKLKLKTITKIRVLDEIVKNKETRMDLNLCESCTKNVQAFIVAQQLGGNQEEGGCNGDCANCDGARI